MAISEHNLELAQSFMRSNSIDVWMIYNFQYSNRIFQHVLGRSGGTTRRAILALYADRLPVLLLHKVDVGGFAEFTDIIQTYTTWQQYNQCLAEMISNDRNVAVDYVPGGQLPISSWVDGGFLDAVRYQGANLVSSADLFQSAFAACSAFQIENHIKAASIVNSIKDEAFSLVQEKISMDRAITEYDVQQFILNKFNAANLTTDEPPIVAVNGNAGDPHYEPTVDHFSEIRRGDWLLIDLWAKHPGIEGIYADITWVAYVGDQVPQKYQDLFDVVKEARDTVLEYLKKNSSKRIEGWELDRVARDIIDAAGYEENFVHRTGHSIGPGEDVHGLGMNLDDFETRESRSVVPNICFSVEPGIYLPELGIRLECNVYIDGDGNPRVETPLQDEIVKLG